MTQVSRGNRPGVALPIRIHELLLSLAGRLDDDALADARQMLASAELDRSLEFVAGCLAAGGVVLTGPQHRELEELFANTYLDPSVIDRVVVRDNAPAYRHRFAVGSVDGREPDRGVPDAIRPVLDVLPDVRSVWCVWRLTPAGPVSGPVPHRLVLVGVGPGGFAPATAYRVEYALRRAGIRASVEVLVDGAQPTDYHQEAMRCARQVPFDDPGPGGGGGRPSMSPVEPVRAEPFAAEPARAESPGAYAPAGPAMSAAEPTPASAAPAAKAEPAPSAAEATSVLPVVKDAPPAAAEQGPAAPASATAAEDAGPQGEGFAQPAAAQGKPFAVPAAAEQVPAKPFAAPAAAAEQAPGEPFAASAPGDQAPAKPFVVPAAAEQAPGEPFAASAPGDQVSAKPHVASAAEQAPANPFAAPAPGDQAPAKPFVVPAAAEQASAKPFVVPAAAEQASAEPFAAPVAGEQALGKPFVAPASDDQMSGTSFVAPAAAEQAPANPFAAPVAEGEPFATSAAGEAEPLAVAGRPAAVEHEASEPKLPSPFAVEPPKIDSVRGVPPAPPPPAERASSSRRMKPVESIKSVFEQERGPEDDEPGQPPSALSVENPTNSRPSPRRRADKPKEEPPSRPRLVPAAPPAANDKHSAAFVDDILNTQERNLLRELQDELARREKQDNSGPWRSGRHGKSGPMAVNGVPPHPDSRGYGSA